LSILNAHLSLKKLGIVEGAETFEQVGPSYPIFLKYKYLVHMNIHQVMIVLISFLQ
jgi:hypothetical protein